MTRQALIINVTRMGDLVQTVPLISRLHAEWPDAAVDLVVDRSFAPMAALLPGLRHIFSYDFQGLIDHARAMAKDVVALTRELSAWVRPLRDIKYDRVINLTFNKRTALLAAYLDAPDTRGVTTTIDGTCVVRNPWLAYFADLHHYRRFNSFNLVDLYALGGSGIGPYTPLTLTVDQEALDWAAAFLRAKGPAMLPIAVQVGASDPMKAWRPEYVGQTMAHISRRIPAAFVMIGTKGESQAIQQVLAAYRAAGGTSLICDAVDQTDLSQLAALLSQCRLLLSNDTGPMHVAVAAGPPVLDISVGHVDYNETGPYGRGHWVIQPDLACAPCGFDQICSHHACKDRLDPEQIAALAVFIVGQGPFPARLTGARILESGIDEDDLACWNLRAGQEDITTQWYRTFWRGFWYEMFTGRKNKTNGLCHPAPDTAHTRAVFKCLAPQLDALVRHADHIVHLCTRSSLPVDLLQAAQAQLSQLRQQATASASASPAFAPLTVSCLRHLNNVDARNVLLMVRQQAQAFQILRDRAIEVMRRTGNSEGELGAVRQTSLRPRTARKENYAGST
ncbi:MAG TPA: glycosyltransferase family 9 protein [Nitrospiraceae bacterium]|nr:glycosyltransferase family 9 protein [Nitrospiraceae bacterium]